MKEKIQRLVYSTNRRYSFSNGRIPSKHGFEQPFESTTRAMFIFALVYVMFIFALQNTLPFLPFLPLLPPLFPFTPGGRRSRPDDTERHACSEFRDRRHAAKIPAPPPPPPPPPAATTTATTPGAYLLIRFPYCRPKDHSFSAVSARALTFPGL